MGAIMLSHLQTTCFPLVFPSLWFHFFLRCQLWQITNCYQLGYGPFCNCLSLTGGTCRWRQPNVWPWFSHSCSPLVRPAPPAETNTADAWCHASRGHDWMCDCGALLPAWCFTLQASNKHSNRGKEYTNVGKCGLPVGVKACLVSTVLSDTAGKSGTTAYGFRKLAYLFGYTKTVMCSN